MARLKRKSDGGDASSPPAPNKRQKTSDESPAHSTRSRRALVAGDPPSTSTRSSLSRASSDFKNKRGPGRSPKSSKAKSAVINTSIKKTVSKPKTTKGRKKSNGTIENDEAEEPPTENNTKVSVDVPQAKKSASNARAAHDDELENSDEGPSYVSGDF